MQWKDENPIVMGEMLRFVAPGTPLRDGIDNVLRAKTGGLIVVGFSDKMKQIVDGGFSIRTSFSPSNLYELAKMDGAIILNNEGQTIMFANVQLMPDPTVVSSETGMRHRTAERVAKQTGNLVIAISERRNVITLYKGNFRYVLRDMGVILTKANQAMQTLEKYKLVLDQGITNLGALEFEDLATLREVVQVMRRIEMVLRIQSEILNYVNELGTEGRLIQLQLTELMSNIEQEAMLLLKDYKKTEALNPQMMLDKMKEVSSPELMEELEIVKVLGYSAKTKLDEVIYPKGYRILYKIPRLPMMIIEQIVQEFGQLNEIVKITPKEIVKVNGVGEVRAQQIKEGLNRIQEQLFFDRHI
ncbi:DNA integrity scanning diadenylate cyclase DisA [Radiobacillus deserti]|uniref:DNA integrity scanning protein DisA n=1 Tax=Radiobacillus deserti TaxID=2594883 RepID=A0A516KBU4_9BACI|nr:DNA integrity scanning diadenylate cyclase DisA [Radiobacillus deserti]QDP38860.1 DNA integrity scanning protein DisA [Radiobacillus deserti]